MYLQISSKAVDPKKIVQHPKYDDSHITCDINDGNGNDAYNSNDICDNHNHIHHDKCNSNDNNNYTFKFVGRD
jgi:hypothetical protein